MMRKIVLLVWTLFLLGTSLAQEKDSLRVGEWSGYSRTYYLHTINYDSLKDFNSLAQGGKIKYTHRFGGGWELGGALYFSLNTGISDLSIPDQSTGRFSRYELGLYDVQDPERNLIVIPGEVYIQYQRNAHQWKAGRFKMNSPFINPQDGRMIPTLVEGLWYKYRSKRKHSFDVGLIYRIAPRSTHKFFKIGESIGKYPVGRNLDGSRSQYAGNTKSDFIVVTHAELHFAPVKIVLWDYWVDNVFHTFYMKPEVRIKDDLQIAIEVVHQDQVGDGGNAIEELRYFADQQSNVLGVEVKNKLGNNSFSLGYDFITGDGRFLFPREWGRESLFSFQKRERSEGAAKAHALLLSLENDSKWQDNQLKTIFSIGRHWKAEVIDAANNKYAFPDYTHFNLDLFYKHQKLKNLRPELLLTYKRAAGDIPENPALFLNKVDMFQVNAIINYNF